MNIRQVLLAVCGIVFACSAGASPGPSLLERLDRGVVALRSDESTTFVSWRLLGTDPAGVEFNVYRQIGGGAPQKVNSAPLGGSTTFQDTPGSFVSALTYTVAPVVGGVEQAADGSFTFPAGVAVQSYLAVPLQIPAPGVTPLGEGYTYHANDCSVGDLNGDGQYEIIVKWDPSNAKDNSQDGVTGEVYLDAYRLDGTRLWRINLGR
ncbi:MAG TPA: hypothetical protein VHF69_11905, partial [Candidatus Synoicihabitans sp.]|nr:hypothetical protein [Candidatus Synoicihabitans sp.]